MANWDAIEISFKSDNDYTLEKSRLLIRELCERFELTTEVDELTWTNSHRNIELQIYPKEKE